MKRLVVKTISLAAFIVALTSSAYAYSTEWRIIASSDPINDIITKTVITMQDGVAILISCDHDILNLSIVQKDYRGPILKDTPVDVQVRVDKEPAKDLKFFAKYVDRTQVFRHANAVHLVRTIRDAKSQLVIKVGTQRSAVLNVEGLNKVSNDILKLCKYD